jgi:hypothetical protein
LRLPNRRTFWLALCAIACVVAPALLWDLGRWPWDIDEVASLQELHLQGADRPEVTGPGTQSSRLPRLIPIWYWCQSLVLNALPITERNARLLSALCTVLVPVAAFATAARRHGPGFASCLALLITLNPLFLALAQQTGSTRWRS